MSGSPGASGCCCQASEFCSHYLPNGQVKFFGVFIRAVINPAHQFFFVGWGEGAGGWWLGGAS